MSKFDPVIGSNVDRESVDLIAGRLEVGRSGYVARNPGLVTVLVLVSWLIWAVFSIFGLGGAHWLVISLGVAAISVLFCLMVPLLGADVTSPRAVQLLKLVFAAFACFSLGSVGWIAGLPIFFVALVVLPVPVVVLAVLLALQKKRSPLDCSAMCLGFGYIVLISTWVLAAIRNWGK